MNMELHFNQEAPSFEEGKGHFATGYTINYLLGKLHLFTRLIVKEKNYTSHLLVHTNPEIKCYLFASLLFWSQSQSTQLKLTSNRILLSQPPNY